MPIRNCFGTQIDTLHMNEHELKKQLDDMRDFFVSIKIPEIAAALQRPVDLLLYQVTVHEIIGRIVRNKSNYDRSQLYQIDPNIAVSDYETLCQS